VAANCFFGVLLSVLALAAPNRMMSSGVCVFVAWSFWMLLVALCVVLVLVGFSILVARTPAISPLILPDTFGIISPRISRDNNNKRPHPHFLCLSSIQKESVQRQHQPSTSTQSNDFPFHLNHRAFLANIFFKKNMFYSNAILAKKGPLGKIWLAAHFKKELNKKLIYATNIRQAVGTLRSLAILFFGAPFAPFTYVASSPQFVFLLLSCFQNRLSLQMNPCPSASPASCYWASSVCLKKNATI
jgi:hypothetical protein